MRSYLSIILILALSSFCPAMPGTELLHEGMKDYQQGNYDAAITKLKSATEKLQSTEDKASAHLALGIIYQLLNDEDQARTQFANAIIVNPDLKLDRDFYSAKTIELFDQAKHEGLDRVKNGKKFYLEGKYEAAIEQINTGINLLLTTSPKIERHIIIDGYLTAAKIYQLLSKNDLAVIEFQKALQVNPDLSLDPELYSKSTMDLFQQAKTEGDRTVSQARALLAQNNFTDAIQLIEKNDNKYYSKTTRKEANFLLAEAYYSSKQTGRAETFATAVLRMDPVYSPATNVTNTTFRKFFEDQRRKTNGEKNKILIVRGANNPVHTLAIDGFKDEIPPSEVKETDASNAADTIKSFKPKVIFATGANSLQAIRKADSQVPVIFVNVLKTEAGNLISKNVGGIYWEVPLEAQFSFLAAVFPKGKRIGIFYNPEVSEAQLKEASAIAPKYGFEIVSKVANNSGQMEEMLSDWEAIDLLWVIPDKSLVNSPDVFRNVLSIATQRRLPVFAYHEAFVKEGALLSVSSDFTLMGKQAAELVQKLLDSKTGPNLPTLSPALSKLALNLKTAKRLGIDIDPNVVTSAAVVYK
jgi:putative ABC transport system substrate-binding protein